MLSRQCQTRVASQIRRLTSQQKATVDEISETDDSLDISMLYLQFLEQNRSSYFDRISLNFITDQQCIHKY